MTPETWEKVKGLFAEALQRPADERPALVSSLAPTPEMAEEVLRLLREDERAGEDFLQPDVDGVAGLLDRAAGVLSESIVKPDAQGSLLAGRYLVIRELGSGGGGVVYLAQDRVLHDRPVVLKFLYPGSESQEHLSQRFRVEIEALARIRHPSVVGALDAGSTEDGRTFLVMEYIDGVTLRAELDAPMTPSRAAALIGKIAEALTAAHQAGVLHRDLKPENVMLIRNGSDESVKLIDFGIAKLRHSAPDELTRTTSIVGTINYVAPEQLRGQVSTASDVYSLGVIAYEMLAGRRPFDPAMPYAQNEAARSGVAPPPSHFQPAIPADADAAVLRALSLDPAQRPSSAAEFARQLAEGLSGRTRRHRRMRLVAALAGIAMTLAAAALIVRPAFRARQKQASAEIEVRRNPNDDYAPYVWIPGGSFMMGCAPEDRDCDPAKDESPHPVSVSGFWIGQTEVTVARYRQFAALPPEPLAWKIYPLNRGWANPNYPMVMLNRAQAARYCRERVGGDLPTEAEWEYAARAGSTVWTPGQVRKMAWFADNSGLKLFDAQALVLQSTYLPYVAALRRNQNGLHDVAKLEPNAWKLYDMLGNAREWVLPGVTRSTPDPPQGIIRGGGWDDAIKHLAATRRDFVDANVPGEGSGFRCVARSIPEWPPWQK